MFFGIDVDNKLPHCNHKVIHKAVQFEFPTDEEIIEVVMTQQKTPLLLTCTITGSHVISWTYNKQLLSANNTQLSDDFMGNYIMYADKPGTYECKMQSSSGLISCRTFNVVTPGKH